MKRASSDVSRVAPHLCDIFQPGNLVEYKDEFIIFVTGEGDDSSTFSGVCVHPQEHKYYAQFDNCFSRSENYSQFLGEVSLRVV